MQLILFGTASIITVAILAAAPASAKTMKQCNAEYSANRAELQGVQKKSDFIAACLAQTGAPPAGSAAGIAGDKASPEIGMGQTPKPTAKDLEDERRLKRDMNICIGC